MDCLGTYFLAAVAIYRKARCNQIGCSPKHFLKLNTDEKWLWEECVRKHSRCVTKRTLRLVSNGRSVYEGARLQPIGALFCQATILWSSMGVSLEMNLYISAEPACVMSIKRFPHSHPFPHGDVLLLGCQARFRLRLRRQSSCSGATVGDKIWKNENHDAKWCKMCLFYFQNPWCWSAVFRHGILNQFVFRYVIICCWNNLLRCPMFI